jgi:hypothetical protein
MLVKRHGFAARMLKRFCSRFVLIQSVRVGQDCITWLKVMRTK